MKAHRRSRKKSSRNLTIFLLAVLVTGACVAVAVYWQTTSVRHVRVSAEEYFQIADVGAFGTFSSKYVLITYIGFQVNATEGDAHDIYVDMDGRSTQFDPPFIAELSKGNASFVEINLTGYRSEQDSDGLFPVKVSISCDEAYGDLWIRLNRTQIQAT